MQSDSNDKGFHFVSARDKRWSDSYVQERSKHCEDTCSYVYVNSVLTATLFTKHSETKSTHYEEELSRTDNNE